MADRTALDFRTAEPRDLVTSTVMSSWTRIVSGDDLLTALQQERVASEGARVLFTLDDIAQCHYTSMHALEDDLLSVDMPDDFDFDDVVQVHDWEVATVQHVASQLRRPDLHPTWDELAGSRDVGPEGVAALASVNAAPTAVLDDQLQALHVDVERDDEVIAGLPNGYFTEDWNVFANHTVALHLAAEFGYRLFGIGASWLGFERDQPLDAATAGRVVQVLGPVYGDHPGWAQVEAALGGKRWLMLGYTDNFAD